MKTIFDIPENEVERMNEEINAMDSNDIENVIKTNNDVVTTLGKEPLFNNMKEFDELMKSDEPIVF